MAKKQFKGGNMLNPLPVVMVTTGEGEGNIITIAWTGIINTNPPMTYISVRPERYSFDLLKESGEFVINLVTEDLAKACDFCGVKSGRNVNKWKETKLTPEKAEKVDCMMIKESPVNLECRVKEVIPLGSHHMFMAEILNVNVDEKIMDEGGRIKLDEAGLVAYNHGEYFGLKKHPLGKFGYSIMKPKTKKRINREKQKNRGKRKQSSR